MSTYRIAVIPGDGIGPEIVAEAIKVLDKVGAKFGHKFEYTYRLMGGAAYDAVGTCFPEDTVAVCKEHDAVLLGAVGGPKWDNLPGAERPEKALLKIREGLGLYANLRPAIMHKALAKACPIKPENIGYCTSAGANVIVAGTAIFGAKKPNAVIKSMRETARNYPFFE